LIIYRLVYISWSQEHPGFEKKMKIRKIHILQRARFHFQTASFRRESK
jgi:hypothetical protein